MHEQINAHTEDINTGIVHRYLVQNNDWWKNNNWWNITECNLR